MAADLGRSQDGTSDVIYGFACTPCYDDAKNKEAACHCAGCKMYYCVRCVEFHRKLFKSHTENEIRSLKSGRKTIKQRSLKVQNAEEFPSDMCHLHPEEAVKMFCGNHDIVCCTVCIALNHRSCKAVEYIPNIAGDLLQEHEIKKTRQELEKVRKDLQTLKITRVAEQEIVDTERKNAIKEIENTRQRIIARADEMETASHEDISVRHGTISEESKSGIGSIDKSLKTIDDELNRMSQHTADKTVSFVRVKQGQRQVLEGKKCYEQVKNNSIQSVSFKMHAHLEVALDQSESFGFVEDTGSPVKAKFRKEYDVGIDSDEETHLLYDICRLENNYLIVTDNANKKLKRLDVNFNVIDYIHLSGDPRSVCTLGRSKLAVTLVDDKKVVFISVGNTMSLGAGFDVGESCRGICSCQDKLYICCGGHPSYDKHPGRIKVYSMIGSILWSFELKQENGNAAFPLGIVSSFDGSKLFIADAFQGFITLEAASGRKAASLSNEKFIYTIGVCEDKLGHLFVCNGRSNNVVQIDKHGKLVQEILTFEDGIEDPLWVILLQNPKRLLVTCRRSSKIKVYCLV